MNDDGHPRVNGETEKVSPDRDATKTVPGRNASSPPSAVPEIGGPSGPEPTRYGDWERRGRCIDF